MLFRSNLRRQQSATTTPLEGGVPVRRDTPFVCRRTTSVRDVLALFDVESWLQSGGLALLAAIVFAESGLLVGFFLPGDSLLFIAGFLTSSAGPVALGVKPDSLPSLPLVAAVVAAAAIVGDQVGYLFGRKVGPSLFQREESRLFKP